MQLLPVPVTRYYHCSVWSNGKGDLPPPCPNDAIKNSMWQWLRTAMSGLEVLALRPWGCRAWYRGGVGGCAKGLGTTPLLTTVLLSLTAGSPSGTQKSLSLL